jgi:hypothetical protein
MNEFPEQRLLWPGAMVASIAHAVFVCRYPDLSNEQSWDGANYNVQDSAGSRATIAFSNERFVGVFFSERSARNPFHSKSTYNLDHFLKDLPPDLQSLAHDEALQYMLQEFKGDTIPIITAAFWGNGKSDRIAAAESWSGVFENGAFLVQNQLVEVESAIQHWKSDFDLRPEEVELVKLLFDRKKTQSRSVIEMNDVERRLWQEIAKGQDGVEASRESFAELGIVLPK